MILPVSARTKVHAIIGDPVAHSLTPAFHNAVYAELGLADSYVMVAARVTPPDLSAAVSGARSLGLNGLTVTTPHKQSIVPLLDDIDADGQDIGAVNTVVRRGDELVGSNTDWIGVTNAILGVRSLDGAKVLLVGAGGAARAAAYGLKSCHADVAVTNRTDSKAKELAATFNLVDVPYSARRDLANLDVIVNCTSLGMGDGSESPVPRELLGPNVVVLETIYLPRETKLVSDARSAGAKVILGIDMFFHQAVAQIERHLDTKIDAAPLRPLFDRISITP